MNKLQIETEIKRLFGLWSVIQEENNKNIDKIRYSGPVLSKDDYSKMLDAIFNGWMSGGSFTIDAEDKISKISNRKYSLLFNSGSSANLALLFGIKELYLKDGDKILTAACGFPTTINAILFNNLKPVFIDIDLKSLNIDIGILESAIIHDKDIKAIFIPHNLGFSCSINYILDLCKRYKIIPMFDACDAYGTIYEGEYVQHFGEASTMSFYAAHHVTCGEGGAVTTDNKELYQIMRGFRNWGRYCSSDKCCIRAKNPAAFCPTSKLTKSDQLPDDYIVNYQYEWIGQNLKPIELQSAILFSQLDMLDTFNNTRRGNYRFLLDTLKLAQCNLGMWDIDNNTSPFAFPILLPQNSSYTRKDLVDFLKKHKIESRLLFGGNLTKHPAYIKCVNKWEIFGNLNNSDIIMNKFLMVGVSPVNGLFNMVKISDVLKEFLECNNRK